MASKALYRSVASWRQSGLAVTLNDQAARSVAFSWVRCCSTSSISTDSQARWKEAMEKQAPRTGDKYLIIGGGFLGQRLADALLLRGETNIRIMDMLPIAAYADDPRVECVQGDVRDVGAVEAATKGIDAVFPTFAHIAYTQSLPFQAKLAESVNVDGTRTVVDASKKNGVSRMVQTSTSHVVLSPAVAAMGMDETAPYVTRESSHNHYSWSKAEAEQLVLGSNSEQMATCAVRPCSGIFGHNDKLILQKSLDDGIAAMLAPKALLDFVYVDNVVWGHLLAEHGLKASKSGVAANAFCITNEEPVDFEDLYTRVQKHQPKLRKLYPPWSVLKALARFVETCHSVSSGRISLGKDLDMLTPASLATLSMSYTFTPDKARNVLGYAPLFSLDEAIKLTVEGHKAMRA